ncbi:MAG: hypothetical protein ACRDRT_16995, partial [Pseudonocardiaceae bacterium]
MAMRRFTRDYAATPVALSRAGPSQEWVCDPYQKRSADEQSQGKAVKPFAWGAGDGQVCFVARLGASGGGASGLADDEVAFGGGSQQVLM